jgi:predicted outer membrane protein
MKRLLIPVCACLAVAAIAAVPTAGAKSNKSSSKVSAADEQYLQTSISGDRFEIIGGRLAEKKSNNAAVQRLAKRLVDDHSKSLTRSSSPTR